ncbi:helix-turn-helix domain-containing protein [Christiangramia crocea]|uniref:Chromosomal replication initiator DnaA C-terminal domain-containing protein n=1 Tax=Christiangramia crocea TaxID=2904124 RepID=A0A9X2A505_9FLAO|nr:helix-turn-helix domain-containing protein [Gramella crocea]MCG9971024.1 hypothetical protein [Gramella crocea]
MIPLEVIHEQICHYYGIEKGEIFKNTRRRDIVERRYMFYYFAKKFNPTMSYQYIGNYSLQKDHATVMHGIRKINDLKHIDNDINKDVIALFNHLTEYQENDKSLILIKEHLSLKIHKCKNVSELKTRIPEFINEL